MANQNALTDDNGYTSLLGASGTSDTSETRVLTTESVAGSVGLHSFILGGTVTTNAAGGGTVVEVASLPDLPGGTIDNVGSVANIGALPQVSVGTIPQVSIGTLPSVTLTDVGTVVQVFSLPDPVGSFVMTGGTLLAIPQVSVGTVPQISVGTIPQVSVGTLPDLPGGTVDLLTSFAAGTANTVGTVGVVNNIVTGTLSSVQINHIPIGSAVQSTHTLGTGGGTFVGTLVAPSGAGTSLYLSGLSIVAHSGTVDCGIANNVAGTTGAGVYARGFFSPSSGIMREFEPVINVGANGTIAYFMISPGTVSFTANYWVTP